MGASLGILWRPRGAGAFAGLFSSELGYGYAWGNVMIGARFVVDCVRDRSRWRIIPAPALALGYVWT